MSYVFNFSIRCRYVWRNYIRGGQLDQFWGLHINCQQSARDMKCLIWTIYGKFATIISFSYFLNNYFSNNYKDYVTIQKHVNKMQYFVLKILCRTLLKTACVSHTSDVYKPQCGHPYIHNKEKSFIIAYNYIKNYERCTLYSSILLQYITIYLFH
jgi:hypothetical protein